MGEINLKVWREEAKYPSGFGRYPGRPMDRRAGKQSDKDTRKCRKASRKRVTHGRRQVCMQAVEQTA